MDAERYLADLEPVGWSLGLERMRALCAALDHPERRFRSLHVVGTNGKTSVTLMTAALLGAGGLRTGACISPHVRRWRERTRLDGAELGEAAFEAAVSEVRAAVESVERDDPEARVTQFEAAIAASFVAFRAAEVEVAVVEAGLGGRLDATNVISSSATALTSVALDHTDWLGETVAEIATEKLAVLEPGTALVTGRLSAEIEAMAARHAAALGARFVVATEPPPGTVAIDLAPYTRRNAAVALELVATIAPRLEPESSRAALATVRLGGRVELVGDAPPLIADAAHNVEGAQGLAEAVEALGAPRPRIGCVSVLSDKDVAGIAAALGPVLDRVICTAAEPGPGMGRPGAHALAPGDLAAAFRRAGVDSEAIGDPAAALGRARELAFAAGGVAICAGSNYLLRYLWTAKPDQNCSR